MSQVCGVCGSSVESLGLIDFHRNCMRNNYPAEESTSFIEYVKCNSCGYTFAPECITWTPEQFRIRIYNDEYPQFDPGYTGERARANAQFLLQMPNGLPRNLRYLDYGSGDGVLTQILKEEGYDAHCYEPHVHIDTDINSLGKFDVITCYEVFEHTHEPKTLMKNLNTLLKPGGMIFFSTQLTDESREDSILDWWYTAPRAGHISLFSAQSLALLGQKFGFQMNSLFPGFHTYVKVLPTWFRQVLKSIGIEVQEVNHIQPVQASVRGQQVPYSSPLAPPPGTNAKLMSNNSNSGSKPSLRQQYQIQQSQQKSRPIDPEKYTDPNIRDDKYTIADYYRSMEVLHAGNLVKGMHLYGARWLTSESAGFKHALVSRNPNWVTSLSQLKGRRVLVAGEQGLGDELMFSQVIPVVENLTSSITLIASFINYDFLHHNLSSDKTTVLDLTTSLGLNATPLCNEHELVTTVGELYRLYIVENKCVPPNPVYTAKYPTTSTDLGSHIAFVFKTNITADTPRAFDPQIYKSLFSGAKIANFQIPVTPLNWSNETVVSSDLTTMGETANLLVGTACTMTCDTAFAHLSLLLNRPTAILYETYIDWRWKTQLYGNKPTLLKLSDKKGIEKFISAHTK